MKGREVERGEQLKEKDHKLARLRIEDMMVLEKEVVRIDVQQSQCQYKIVKKLEVLVASRHLYFRTIERS